MAEENTQSPSFQPGFRLSTRDVIVIVVGSVAAAGAAAYEWWLGALIAFPLLHFFLFCNVFRVSRGLELIWAAAFVLCTSWSMTRGELSWGLAFGVPLVVIVFVIWRQLVKPSYHGMGWQRVN